MKFLTAPELRTIDAGKKYVCHGGCQRTFSSYVGFCLHRFDGGKIWISTKNGLKCVKNPCYFKTPSYHCK